MGDKTTTNKPFYKRWWFILIVVVFVIGGIGNLFESEESKQEKEDEKVAAEQEEKEKEQKQKEEEEKKKEEEERKANRTIDEAIEEDSLNVDNATFKDGVLTLEKEPSSSWDETSLVKNNVYKLFEAMNEGFKDDDVDKVKVDIQALMIDDKGNEEVESGVAYEYDRETFEELNYDNFIKMAASESWRILNESNEYLIHPGIYKSIKNDYKKELKHNGMKTRE